jgi:hypothetical protein
LVRNSNAAVSESDIFLRSITTMLCTAPRINYRIRERGKNESKGEENESKGEKEKTEVRGESDIFFVIN